VWLVILGLSPSPNLQKKKSNRQTKKGGGVPVTEGVQRENREIFDHNHLILIRWSRFDQGRACCELSDERSEVQKREGAWYAVDRRAWDRTEYKNSTITQIFTFSVSFSLSLFSLSRLFLSLTVLHCFKNTWIFRWWCGGRKGGATTGEKKNSSFF
jgi:hypothetical protein